MGLILKASCACGYSREGLRLGATMAQMSGDRRSSIQLHRCVACRDLAQVDVPLGEPLDARCDRCRAPLALARSSEVRVVTMSGERLEGHACPRCEKATLRFENQGSFI